jgi:hypothetical protein
MVKKEFILPQLRVRQFKINHVSNFKKDISAKIL